MRYEYESETLGNQHINIPDDIASIIEEVDIKLAETFASYSRNILLNAILGTIAIERDRMWKRCKNDTLLANYDDEIRSMIYDYD